MGLIISDNLTLPSAITISNYYINTGEIKINKSNVEGFTYSISFEWNVFSTKQARLERKKKLFTHNTIITTDSLDNIYQQIYTELKQKFENHTDDL